MAPKPFRKGRPKKRVRHREPTSQEAPHWLGNEIDVEGVLRSELDPLLFAIDDALHRSVNSTAHAYDGNERRPCAIFLPVPDSIGWQSTYISKEFNTYLLSAEPPEGMVETSDKFNILFLDFDAFDRVDFWVDIFVATSYAWNNAHDFFTFMNANLPLLSPGARAYVVLQGHAPLTIDNDEEIFVSWFDGSESRLGQLLSYRWYRDARPNITRTICLPAINPEDPQRLQRFTKRNKSFFEKDVGPILRSMLDSDQEFRQFFELPDDGRDAQWAILLEWKSPATFD